MKNGYILAIDQGTTGTTVLIFDHAGRVRGRAYSEITQYYPQPGWVEHDPDEIFSVTIKVIGAALRAGDIAPDDLAAIGITNQRETVLLWERESGRALGRAIVWQDRRTAPACDVLRAEGLEPLIQARTGLVIDPYFSASKLKWLLDQDPALRARAARGELCAGTVDSWLVYRLTGGREHSTDYSNASRTLLYDIRALRWDPELLALFEIPEALLPRVLPSAAVRGQTDPQRFFGTRPVPIAGVAGDQQAALFGQACQRPGMAKNTYGTGSFVLMHTGVNAVTSNERLLTTIAWGIRDEPVEYALEGAVFVTGAAVQWLRDGLGIIDAAGETEALACSLGGNDGVYFVPALTGLGAPYWDPYARGLLIGLTRGTARAHLARAALEAMCYQTRDVIEAMQRDAGIALTTLRCDGGASVNRFLMQFQADLLGVEVEVPRITETTALGAAYLAGLGVGFWVDRDELAATWDLDNRYHADADPARRDALYRRWRDAVERCRGWALADAPA